MKHTIRKTKYTPKKFAGYARTKVQNLLFRLERGGRPPSGRNGYRIGTYRPKTIVKDFEFVLFCLKDQFAKLDAKDRR